MNLAPTPETYVDIRMFVLACGAKGNLGRDESRPYTGNVREYSGVGVGMRR